MIGVDWGTTHLRAYRIAPNGEVLASRAAPKGILAVSDGDFAAALESVIGDWLGAEPAPVMMSGMIGSRQGWLEAPYLACPATPAAVADGLVEVRWGRGRRAFICPGLTFRDHDGAPDVMRGEEVQVFGALALQDRRLATICLPGTHSKHVAVSGGAVERFSTFMTGEVFAVLCQHSILGRTMTQGPVDWRAFDDGVERASRAGGLLHHLFGARTRVLMGDLASAGEADYLSGMLIGHEMLAASGNGPVVIVGAVELAERYRRAFQKFDRPAEIVASDAATAAGLRLIRDISAARAA